MRTSDLIFSKARNPSLKVGIGADSDKRDKVDFSAREATRKGFGKVEVFTDAKELIEALREGRIDAAIRGDLDSNLSMRTVKKLFGVDRILRVALLQPQHGPLFFLAPVGVDEGWTVEEKLEFIELIARLLKSLGVRPKVGVMSGGRNTDRGRSEIVDRSINEAEEVARLALARGFDCINAEILIEDAARNCNVVIAPDGISGNLIFRTLHFLGEGKASGAPILNIDAVFVDTSRAKGDYIDSIALACALATNKKV